MDEESEAVINLLIKSKEPVPYTEIAEKCKSKSRFYVILGKLDFYGFLIYEENGKMNSYGYAGVMEGSNAEKWLKKRSGKYEINN